VKLASLPDGSRDGRLVVVDDRAGRVGLVPTTVVPNLRTALETWSRSEKLLRRIDRDLQAGTWAETKPVADCTFLAPLPRTTSWLDGSAFLQHVLLVRKARGAEPPADLRTVPLMYQGVGDPLLAPTADIAARSEEDGIDLEAEIGVVLDDVPMGTKAAKAARHIRLLVLMNDVSLRNLIPRELAAGFGFFQGKPPSSLGPYAVTPDELGAAWRDGRLHLDMQVQVNGKSIGHPSCGPMHFSFPQLVEHAATTRPLPAGTVLGSGTVSNEDTKRGCGCLAEVRVLETLAAGKPTTPFLRFGDRVRLEVLQEGRSVFGVIDQKVVPARAV
jgi:fumarylacetoacetate (FAA) hydrolase